MAKNIHLQLRNTICHLDTLLLQNVKADIAEKRPLYKKADIGYFRLLFQKLKQLLKVT